MAALLDADVLGMPVRETSEQSAQLVAESIVPHSTAGGAFRSLMPELVKGAGFAKRGGNQPLADDGKIALMAHQGTLMLKKSVRDGYHAKADVVKSMNQGFLAGRGALAAALTMPSINELLAQVFNNLPGGPEALAKSFTAGNLGIGSVSGLTPFNLLAPSRLVYPVPF